MARILIVEDEAVIADAAAAYLTRENHSVFIESNGISARDRIINEDFDLIILDLMLPGLSGEEICREIRRHSSVPVLMLTAKSDEGSLLYGFRIGADDYLTKPFSPRELVVRVNALLRRAGNKPAAEFLEFDSGRFKLNLKNRRLVKSGKEVHLTPIEFDILEKLVSHPGKVFSREEIICSVMGFDFEGTDRTVDSHIRNLRAKIEKEPKNPVFIITRRGAGFYFNV